MRTHSINKLQLTVVALLMLVAYGNVASAKQKQQPNIIFILTDDQRFDALGYAGNEIIHTPEMDKLAQEGTYFKKAFVTTPICATSRASIFTGLNERTHNYTFQRGPIKEAYMKTSYPNVLNEGGYHTGFFGKFGVAYEKESELFDEMESYDRNNKYADERGYFYKTIGEDTVHLTRYTGHKGQEFIANAPKNKPFFLSLCFSAPHAHDKAPLQYFWQETLNELYGDVTVPGPIMAQDKYFNQLPQEVRLGFNRTRWYWRYDTPEKYQHSMKGYYRMISGVDAEIGMIRKQLEEKGIADNTVIIFMGDNGHYFGERQIAGKWLMHDNSLRVPMMIVDPRVNEHRDIEDMVLNIDVTKTILDVAGLEAPEIYQGISLLPYVTEGKHEDKHETILVEHLWEISQIPSSEGIRSENWKYFRYRFIDAPEELYNLKTDPLEKNNLALDPAYDVLLHNFRNELEYKTRQCVDAKLVSDFTDPKYIKKNF